MSMMGNGGPSVLQEGATEEKGEHARLASFVGAMAISDLVKSTLGPKGMDKILLSMGQGRQVTVTNDGATILKSIYVDNAAAKVSWTSARPRTTRWATARPASSSSRASSCARRNSSSTRRCIP